MLTYPLNKESGRSLYEQLYEGIRRDILSGTLPAHQRLPSNEGRGYVLRRLLRRAARHGKLLGVNDPFLYQVVDTVIHENEGQYPDLREKQTYITKVIRTEEENFAKTLDAGMKIYDDMLSAHKAQGLSLIHISLWEVCWASPTRASASLPAPR